MRAPLRFAHVAVVALFAAAAPAAAQPIDFEGVAPASVITTLSGYSFTGFFGLDNAGAGFGTNASSGSRFAYVGAQNNSPDPSFGSVYADRNFNLSGAYLSLRGIQGAVAGPVAITVNAYRGFDPNADPVFTQVLQVTDALQLFQFDFTNVSEVEFLTDGADAAGALLAVDDLGIAAIPEPTTVVLFGAGAAALALAGRARRRTR